MTTLTERELFSQAEILPRILADIDGKKGELSAFFASGRFKRILFAGCGTSYCISHSGAWLFRHIAGFDTEAVAAGDMLVQFDRYAKSLDGALVVFPSRSGQTSEAIRLAELVKRNGASCRILSLVGTADTPLAKLSDYALEWPFMAETSVCQTRTITSIFAVFAALAGLVGNDESLYAEIKAKAGELAAFLPEADRRIRDFLKGRKFDGGLVLADAELYGLADAAAMGIKEISMKVANSYHLLDVRHGPMVAVNSGTLAFLAIPDAAPELLNPLVADIKKRGASVVTVQGPRGAVKGGDLDVATPDCRHPAALGLFFFPVVQLAALRKALADGHNPDTPPSLSPWIALEG